MPLPASAIAVRRRFLAARDVRVLRFHTPGGHEHDQKDHAGGGGGDSGPPVKIPASIYKELINLEVDTFDPRWDAPEKAALVEQLEKGSTVTADQIPRLLKALDNAIDIAEDNEQKAKVGRLRKFADELRGRIKMSANRTPSRAASRCNFAAIKQRENALAKTAVPEAAAALARAVKRALGDDEQLTSLLDNDPQDIAALALNGADVGRIRSAFDGALETAFETGRVTGANEVTKAGEKREKAARERFAALREKAAGYIAANGFRMAENVSEATRAIIQAELLTGVKVGKRPAAVREAIWDALVRKGLTSREAALGVETDEAVVGALDELWAEDEPGAAHYLDTLVRTNSFEAMNEARFQEFTDPALEGFVQALEYSAILDENTTDICEHLDGRIYAANSEVWDTYRPPNHYNCRSLLIPVTAVDGWKGEESEPPSLEPQAGFFSRCSHAEHFHTPGGHEHDQKDHAGGRGGSGDQDSDWARDERALPPRPPEPLKLSEERAYRNAHVVLETARAEGIHNVEIDEALYTWGPDGREALAVYQGSSDKIRFSLARLGAVQPEILRGVLLHENGHRDLTNAMRVLTAPVHDFVRSNINGLRREGEKFDYARQWWDRVPKGSTTISPLALYELQKSAVQESYAEMRRVGKLGKTYEKLDAFVRPGRK